MNKLSKSIVFIVILLLPFALFPSTSEVQAQSEWDDYHSFEDIESGLQELETLYSSIVLRVDLGDSYWGRDIWAIKISDDPSTNDPEEPDILFVGLHHAREWISAEVPYYLAVNLVEQYATDPTIEALIEAAVDIGLPPDIVPELVLQTVLGAGHFLQESGRTPADLRQMVTSPGGTTAAALRQLEAGSFTELIKKAVAAPYDRARELGAR